MPKPLFGGAQDSIDAVHAHLERARALSPGRSTPFTVLLVGGPGSGKTHAMESLLSSHNGPTVAIRCRRGTRLPPGAGVLLGIEALAVALQAPDLRTRLTALIRSCLDDHEDGTVIDPSLIGEFAAQVERAEPPVPSPLHIFIDDADLLDPFSATFYSQFVEHPLHARSTVVLTSSDPVLAQSFPSALVVPIRPLTADGVAAVTEARDGEPIPLATAEQVLALTDGSPVLVCELIDALSPAQRNGLSRIPRALPLGRAALAHVERVRADLDPAEEGLLRTLALLAPLSVPLASRLAAETGASLDSLTNRGLVHRRGARVTPADGALARWHLSSPGSDRDESAAVLAAHADHMNAHELLRLRAASTAHDPAIAEEILPAADERRASGDHEQAQALWEHVWRHAEPAQHGRILLGEARAAADEGLLHDAAELAQSTLDATDDHGLRLEAARIAIRARYDAEESVPVDLVADELTAEPPAQPAHAEEAAGLLIDALEQLVALGQLDLAQELLARAEPGLRPLAPAHEAALAYFDGVLRPDGGDPDTLLRAWASAARPGRAPWSMQEALTRAGTGRRGGTTGPSATRRDLLRALLRDAQEIDRDGEPDQLMRALTRLDRRADRRSYRPTARAALLLTAQAAHSMLPPDAGALSLLDRLLEARVDTAPRLSAHAALAAGLLHAIHDDLTAAHERLREAWGLVRGSPGLQRHDPRLSSLLPLAHAIVLVRRGDRDRLRELASSPLVHAQDVPLLSRIAEGTRLRPDELDAHLRRSSGGLAPIDRERLRLLLAGRPTTPPAPLRLAREDDLKERFALTDREHEIALLVAGGMRNRDISAKLFLSLRTVEATLTSLYRKVSVRSRSELVGIVHGSAPTPPELQTDAITLRTSSP